MDTCLRGRVRQGKERSSVIGATTRQALLAYRLNLTNVGETSPSCLAPNVEECLRAKMRLLHLQYLGCWTSTEVIDHYTQMVDEELLQEHKAHSPVANL